MAEGFTMNMTRFEASNPSHGVDEINNTELNLLDESDEDWDDSDLHEKLKRILKETNEILKDQTFRMQLDIQQTIKDIQNTIYPYIQYKFLKKDGTLQPFDKIKSEFQRIFNIDDQLHEDQNLVDVHGNSETPNIMVIETPDFLMDPSTCKTLFDLIDWISVSRNFQPRISEKEVVGLKLKFEDFCSKTQELRNNLVKMGIDLRSSINDASKRLKTHTEYYTLNLTTITEVKLETLEDHVNLNGQLKSMNEILCDFLEKWEDLELLRKAAEEYSETKNRILQEIEEILRTQITVLF